MAKTLGIIFGRFNPPHKGHRAAWEMASKCTYWYVGTNKSTIGPKDPLPYEVKVSAMETIWPTVKGHIMPETSWLTMAAALFAKHGDIPLYCFTDEDWVVETLKKYNGVKNDNGDYYDFSVIQQKKTPRLSSATALRAAVKDNDPEKFADAAGVPADTLIKVGGKKQKFFDVVKKFLSNYTKEEVIYETIVRTKKGYVLYSKSTPRKKLGGPYSSKEAAEKRERQIQYFKHMNESDQLKTFGQLSEELNKACWKGYKAVGTKKKDGKVVPNCVPVKEEAKPTGYPIPDKVKEAAQEGINLRKEYKRGGTPAAIQMAKDIMTKDELALPKIKAMKAYFFRNKTEVQKGEAGHRPSSKTIPSDEWIAWQLYGGNAGRDWAERVLNPKKQNELNTDEDNQ